MQVQVLSPIHGKPKNIQLKHRWLYHWGDDNGLNRWAGIYLYRLKSDKSKIYIGSATKLAQRFRQQLYRCSVYEKSNQKLYSLVNKYGWDNLEHGVLELVEFPPQNSTTANRTILLAREQVYLDKYKPSVKINKIAGSVMGYKHTESNKLKFGSLYRGKSYSKTLKPNSLRDPVSENTILKLRPRAKGAKVNIFLKDLQLFKSFPTIKSAA